MGIFGEHISKVTHIDNTWEHEQLIFMGYSKITLGVFPNGRKSYGVQGYESPPNTTMVGYPAQLLESSVFLLYLV